MSRYYFVNFLNLFVNNEPTKNKSIEYKRWYDTAVESLFGWWYEYEWWKCLKTSRSTALHLAAGKGLSEICLLLLEKGGRCAAEVERRNNCVRVAVMIEGYDGGDE